MLSPSHTQADVIDNSVDGVAGGANDSSSDPNSPNKLFNNIMGNNTSRIEDITGMMELEEKVITIVNSAHHPTAAIPPSASRYLAITRWLSSMFGVFICPGGAKGARSPENFGAMKHEHTINICVRCS